MFFKIGFSMEGKWMIVKLFFCYYLNIKLECFIKINLIMDMLVRSIL